MFLPAILVVIGLAVVVFHIAARKHKGFKSHLANVRKRLAARRQARRERRLKRRLQRAARRLARRTARKESGGHCLDRLLSRVAFWRRPSCCKDEEKAAFLDDEKACYSDANISRQKQTSVVDDIAEFRAAVSVVDDIVADQEARGRTKGAELPGFISVSQPAGATFVGCEMDDDVPPAYEAYPAASEESSGTKGEKDERAEKL